MPRSKRWGWPRALGHDHKSLCGARHSTLRSTGWLWTTDRDKEKGGVGARARRRKGNAADDMVDHAQPPSWVAQRSIWMLVSLRDERGGHRQRRAPTNKLRHATAVWQKRNGGPRGRPAFSGSSSSRAKQTRAAHLEPLVVLTASLIPPSVVSRVPRKGTYIAKDRDGENAIQRRSGLPLECHGRAATTNPGRAVSARPNPLGTSGTRA